MNSNASVNWKENRQRTSSCSCPLFFFSPPLYCPTIMRVAKFTVRIKLSWIFLHGTHRPHIYGTVNHSTKRCANSGFMVTSSPRLHADVWVWWKTGAKGAALRRCCMDKLSDGLTEQSRETKICPFIAVHAVDAATRRQLPSDSNGSSITINACSRYFHNGSFQKNSFVLLAWHKLAL